MFLTGKSWEGWLRFFEKRGYECVAPDWPLHSGEPAKLRALTPAGTGALGLNDVTEYFASIAQAETKPVLIGHSLGGLVVQKLVDRGLAAAAVCITPAAPNAMLSFDWSFLKNSLAIANPLKGDVPFQMTAGIFFQNLGNTMSRAESDRAYRKYAVHESRKVLRDVVGESGHIDLSRSHVPLLFIAAEKDELIPAKLVEKNAAAYSDPHSIVDCHQFSSRGHFICGEPGWEEVATYAAAWIEHNSP